MVLASKASLSFPGGIQEAKKETKRNIDKILFIVLFELF
jgi:hypothetical protein